MEVNYTFSVLSLQRLLEILEKRHENHLRDDQCRVTTRNNTFIFCNSVCSGQASFKLEVSPLDWGPDQVFFQTCDTLDELILVVRFILKHKLEVRGKLVATFYK